MISIKTYGCISKELSFFNNFMKYLKTIDLLNVGKMLFDLLEILYSKTNINLLPCTTLAYQYLVVAKAMLSISVILLSLILPG